MKYTLYMTEVSTTWVDRDQCPQFNTGEELKGILSAVIQVSDQRQQRAFSKQTQKHSGKYSGKFFVHLFHRLMLYGTLALILIHYLKRKISKNMFFVLKCGKTNY